MPFALVRYNPKRIPTPVMSKIMEELPASIATALHVEQNPDARLTPNDIEADVREFGELDVTGPYDLTVFIFANFYPERVAVVDYDQGLRFIDVASKQIAEDIIVQLH